MAKTIALLLALLCFVPPAIAQDINTLSEEQRTLLGRLFTDARTAYEARDYPTSIARLEDAYALLPEPNILYRIAEMREELGERDAAIEYYSRYFEARPDAPNAAVVKTRIERLRAEQEAARPKTARLTIDSSPQGARVYLNTVERKGSTPIELDVPPGTHSVRLELEGHQDSSRTIDVEAGELRTFDFRLRPIEIAEVPVQDTPSPMPWVFAGLGVSSGIASVVLLVLAADKQNTLDKWDDARQTATRPPEYDSVLDQELAYRTFGWTAAGVSAVSLITAGIWWWVDSDSEPTVLLSPQGVTLQASF